MTDRRRTGISGPCGADVAAFALGALERSESRGSSAICTGAWSVATSWPPFSRWWTSWGAAASRRAVPKRIRRKVVGEVSRAASAHSAAVAGGVARSARPAAVVALAAMLFAVAIGVSIRE